MKEGLVETGCIIHVTVRHNLWCRVRWLGTQTFRGFTAMTRWCSRTDSLENNYIQIVIKSFLYIINSNLWCLQTAQHETDTDTNKMCSRNTSVSVSGMWTHQLTFNIYHLTFTIINDEEKQKKIYAYPQIIIYAKIWCWFFSKFFLINITWTGISQACTTKYIV